MMAGSRDSGSWPLTMVTSAGDSRRKQPVAATLSKRRQARKRQRAREKNFGARVAEKAMRYLLVVAGIASGGGVLVADSNGTAGADDAGGVTEDDDGAGAGFCILGDVCT